VIFYIFIGFTTLWSLLIFSAILHELFHFLAAKAIGIKVPVFSLGLWKPYIKKVFKGTEFRITPWLLVGAYVELEGDKSKHKVGWKAQPYLQKLFIVYAGILANLLIVLICYAIHYKSVTVGLTADITLWRAIISKDTVLLYSILAATKSLPLLVMSSVNLGLAVINLIPLPAVDGGFFWIFALEKVLKDKFMLVYNVLISWGLYVALLLQLILCWYLFRI